MPSALRINNPRMNDHAQAVGYAAFKNGQAKDAPEAVFPQRYRDEWRARQKPPKESKTTTCSDPKPKDRGQ